MSQASLQRTVIVVLINIVLVVGLYVFTGNSGVYSFGHPAFAMLGAYVGGLLVMSTELKEVQVPDAPDFLRAIEVSPVLAVLIAGLVAALVAIPIAIPLSRIGGLSAGLATVAMLLSMNVIASEWTDVTRGRRALSSIPTETTLASALFWVFIVLLLAGLHQTSSSGRQLRASRDDEIAAAASGVRTPLLRGRAFVLSAFVTGVGGALFGMFLGSVSPSVFYLDYTFIVIAMLVVGGAHSLTGAVLGAAVIGILQGVPAPRRGRQPVGARHPVSSRVGEHRTRRPPDRHPRPAASGPEWRSRAPMVALAPEFGIGGKVRDHPTKDQLLEPRPKLLHRPPHRARQGEGMAVTKIEIATSNERLSSPVAMDDYVVASQEG
ncbi:branched-chain amino acid ABC transporter permease [Nocardioides sp. B-3]|uniref:branched-chain amino acid ABC transporter permease n=1 Tax=Nocardioides sp. B-3 TaxID=2895565 RepID=UPI002152DD87|nr:branched-chain amino acid ABC transporter permease [Nocardioides sp. B-3]UUZ59048.1 branched-chain amino acid ABC transporter permease [Nocardioides sp. B-3]